MQQVLSPTRNKTLCLIPWSPGPTHRHTNYSEMAQNLLFVGSSTGTESEVRSNGGSGNSFRSGKTSEVGVPEEITPTVNANAQ